MDLLPSSSEDSSYVPSFSSETESLDVISSESICSSEAEEVSIEKSDIEEIESFEPVRKTVTFKIDFDFFEKACSLKKFYSQDAQRFNIIMLKFLKTLREKYSDEIQNLIIYCEDFELPLLLASRIFFETGEEVEADFAKSYLREKMEGLENYALNEIFPWIHLVPTFEF